MWALTADEMKECHWLKTKTGGAMQRAKPAHKLEEDTNRSGELGASPLRSLEKAHHFGRARRRAPAVQRNDPVIFCHAGITSPIEINMRNERKEQG
jgi:hypothetical protein